MHTERRRQAQDIRTHQAERRRQEHDRRVYQAERRRQTQDLSQRLREAMSRRLERRLLPIDGRWLYADEAKALHRHNRRRAWEVLVELLLLIGLLGLITFVFVQLTRVLAY